MATNSRTDKSTIQKHLLTENRRDATRLHTDPLRAADSLRVIFLKGKGCSCNNCSLSLLDRYTLHCKGYPESSGTKIVKSYTICSRWKRK